MFIRPIDVSTIPGNTWQDRAGNTHFTLQSKKKDNAFGAFLSGFSNIGITGEAAYRRSIAEYDFRILLNLETRKQRFVVAVDETFDKIHTVPRTN